jgi:hypothetical protein
MDVEALLRSINVRYDAEHPERIAHFQPTAKSVVLIRALLAQEAERAFFIVAPYGSGKSLTATYLLHFIENRVDSATALRTIGKRLAEVSPELGQFAAKRLKGKRQSGLALALHGYCPSLSQSLQSAAVEAMTRLKLGGEARKLRESRCDNVDQAIELLNEVQRRACKLGLDRVLIIWDEFGRHIESLVAEGRPAALVEIQTLAEFVSRSRKLPMTLGLLLHQGLLRYAGNMPQSIRAEWTKIEGRFHTIQYLDDSKELYRLIGEVVTARKPNGGPPKSALTLAARECKRLKLFPDFSKSELQELLTRTYPLEPVTLRLLPRLSGRVAQNERTLFNFLYSVELQQPIGPEHLYDYFSPAMQADTAVGGTYRQWLETQSALSKVGESGADVLKAACLLGLGAGGERARANRDLLYFALRGYGVPNGEDKLVENLVERKLLLHRKHSDEVSVWHGTDVDLRGRLEEEKDRYKEQFDLLAFLTREDQPPFWRPAEYNDEYGVRRYLSGEYHNAATLNAYLEFTLPLGRLPVGCDGKVVYVLTETIDELSGTIEAVRDRLKDERVIVAVPRQPLAISEVALEVACLLRMQLDGDLVGSDPLIAPELQQMTDDARGHLQQLIDHLVQPSVNGPRWFYRGGELKAESPRDLRKALSRIMGKVFKFTPRINNEMIVRNKPSGPIVNARKKLLFAILEHSGKENVGIEGNFPDASMLRTVLLHTGLYRQDEGGRWGYAQPKAIKDPGLRRVWGKICEFLTAPSEEPKHLRKFFNELMEPPFGLRAGLLPILFCAGLRAFPSARTLTKNGTYVTDILPSEVEELCRQPELYRLVVLNLDEARQAYLHGFHKCFSGDQIRKTKQSDIIRLCFDALESWKAQLPAAALTSKRVSDAARKFQSTLSRQADPVDLLLHVIPGVCDCSIDKHGRLLEAIARQKKELEGVVDVYHERAAASVRRALAFGHEDTGENVREAASGWAYCFAQEFIDHLKDGVAKGLLSRMRTNYKTDELLLESLSSLLLGKSISRWDDSAIAIFDREIHDVVHRIEEAALSVDLSLTKLGTGTHGLAALVSGRMTELFERLVRLVGPERARAIASSVLEERTEGDLPHGNDKRSARQSIR